MRLCPHCVTVCVLQVAYVQRLECPLSVGNALTHPQLKAFRKRKVAPARLTMQERP